MSWDKDRCSIGQEVIDVETIYEGAGLRYMSLIINHCSPSSILCPPQAILLKAIVAEELGLRGGEFRFGVFGDFSYRRSLRKTSAQMSPS